MIVIFAHEDVASASFVLQHLKPKYRFDWLEVFT